MPSYALRYVFFGTRWGSNSSFAMVNLVFTSFCPARILLPCPDSDPLNCRLSYSKTNMTSVGLPASSVVPGMSGTSASGSNRSQHAFLIQDTAYSEQNATVDTLSSAAVWQSSLQCRSSVQVNISQDGDTSNMTGSMTVAGAADEQERPDLQDLHFPVLVPLWQIYVRERPLPIFLHTTFMTVSALLWPLQVRTSDSGNVIKAAYIETYQSLCDMYIISFSMYAHQLGTAALSTQHACTANMCHHYYMIHGTTCTESIHAAALRACILSRVLW